MPVRALSLASALLVALSASASAQSLLPATADPSPLVAVVSLKSQRISVFDRTGEIASSPVSSGRKGYETPRGIFSVLERKEEHFSNLYDDAPMPFMQRLTWSGVALHAGHLPGYPASHGCIRLPHAFSQKLFGLTRRGTRVIVTDTPVTPVTFSHPVLASLSGNVPAPAAVAAAEPVRTAGELPVSDLKLMRLGAPVPADALPQAEARPAAAPAVVTARMLDAERAEATRALSAAETDLAAARAAHAKTQRDNREALALVTQGRRLVADAERRLDAALNARFKARTERAAIRAEEAEEKAEADIERGRRMIAEHAPATTSAEKAVAETQARLDQATARHAAVQTRARELDRKARPVSIFVSRKTQKLYIRQGYEPVLETPVTIRDAHRPLGTHVLTAMTARHEPSTVVTWSAVTIEAGEAPRGTNPAAAALDRITVPPATLATIAPALRPGASFIVSDERMSPETGWQTDFIVETE